MLWASKYVHIRTRAGSTRRERHCNAGSSPRFQTWRRLDGSRNVWWALESRPCRPFLQDLTLVASPVELLDTPQEGRSGIWKPRTSDRCLSVASPWDRRKKLSLQLRKPIWHELEFESWSCSERGGLRDSGTLANFSGHVTFIRKHSETHHNIMSEYITLPDPSQTIRTDYSFVL